MSQSLYRNQSASMFANNHVTKSGNEVRRTYVSVEALQEVLDKAKSEGHDMLTIDMDAELRQFKNNKKGYIATLRSWKSTPKK